MPIPSDLVNVGLLPHITRMVMKGCSLRVDYTGNLFVAYIVQNDSFIACGYDMDHAVIGLDQLIGRTL